MRKFAGVLTMTGLTGALAGLMTFGATPAGATSTTSTTYTAVASWTPPTSDPGAPNVSLQVTEEAGPTNSVLYFSVNESQCVAGTEIFRSYLFDGPQTEQFSVKHNLSHATLLANRIAGTYTEQTAPECDSNGTDLTTVFSKSARVSITGAWKATGPASTTFPGNVVRPAEAEVLAKGPAALGLSGLGAPTFAQLSSYTS
jgi:hypothetical protein